MICIGQTPNDYGLFEWKKGKKADVSSIYRWSLTDILATQLENMSNVSHAPRGVVDILINLAIFFLNWFNT